MKNTALNILTVGVLVVVGLFAIYGLAHIGNNPMLSQIITLNADKSVNLDFDAQSLLVNNPTGQYIYINPGSNEIPSIAGAKITIPPGTYISQPIPPSRNFGIHLGNVAMPTSANVSSATVTFFDQPQAVQISNIALPSVVFEPLWDLQDSLLNAGAIKTLITPPTGMKIKIYQVYVFILTPASAIVPCEFLFGPSSFGLWPTSLTANKSYSDGYSWQQEGTVLPVNAALKFQNLDVAQEDFIVGVFYQFQ